MAYPDHFIRMRPILLIGWGMALAAAHWQSAAVFVVPILALITFPALSPFSIVLSALLLSGYLDLFPASLPPALKLLLIGIIWLSALGTIGIRLRCHGDTLLSPGSPAHEEADGGKPLSPTVNFRHDLQTPVNLILGFCQALLTPASAFRPPIPASYREDIEALYRNAKLLASLHEKLFTGSLSLSNVPSVESVTAVSQPTLILLDSSGAASELFSQYLRHHKVVSVPDVEALGRLKLEVDPAAIVISADDPALVPITAQLIGKKVPILTFRLAGALPTNQPQGGEYGSVDYLTKPIEFQALAMALERIGATPHDVLIVDDNRDHVQLLSRMFASLPQPPHILKAYSGREALALMGENTPDLILLDFVLPDMDGLILLDYLRADSRLAQIPVVLVSAHRPPDVLPIPNLSKLTVFRLSGFSPAQLVQYVEASLSALNPEG